MSQRVLVTGASSFLGRHIVAHFERVKPGCEVLAFDPGDADFSRLDECVLLFERVKPDAIVHAARYVPMGGLLWEPADRLYQNLAMMLSIFEAAAFAGVKSIITLASSTSYPAAMPGPLFEAAFLKGAPDPAAGPSAEIDRLAPTMAESYRTQYGINAGVLILPELFGEHMRFQGEQASRTAEIIRLLIEAHQRAARSVTLPTSAKASFDLVYADDVAAVIAGAIETPINDILNVTSGFATSVEQIVAAAREALGYEGEVEYASEPTPHDNRVLDATKFQAHGLNCPTVVEKGVAKVIAHLLREGAAAPLELSA